MKRLLLLLLLLVLALCLCAGCGSGGHTCPGGREIVLRAVPQHGESLTSAGMRLARDIISSRLQTIGVGSPTVAVRGRDEIVVSGSVPKTLARFASVTGNLQFFDFEKDLASPTVKNGNPTPYPTLYSLLATPAAAVSNGPPGAFYLLQSRAPHRVLRGPTGTFNDLLAPYGGKTPNGTTVFTVPANREVVSGTRASFTAATRPVKQSPDGTYWWYLFKLPPAINGKDLRESAVTASTDPNTGQPEVTLSFTRHGSKEFQAITKAEYDRGQLVAGLHGSAGQFNPLYAQHNAIVLDGKLEAAPYIDYTDAALSLGIAGGQAVINNMGSSKAANDLALVLQSGSLPYRFELVSSRPCGR